MSLSPSISPAPHHPSFSPEVHAPKSPLLSTSYPPPSPLSPVAPSILQSTPLQHTPSHPPVPFVSRPSYTFLRQPIEEQNWICLIGLPVTAVNNLSSRFDEGLISDLPSFLRQNWAPALYHDRFGEFRQAVRGELADDEDWRAALQAARPPAEEGKEGVDVGAFLGALPEGKAELVRMRLRDFVQTNKNQLDMYLVPPAR